MGVTIPEAVIARAEHRGRVAARGAALARMSQIAFLGALELGLIYGLVALGVFLSFRVLSFPDLTVDGSFPLGAAVASSAIVAGLDPYLGTLMALLAGALAGLVTAILNVRFGILHLLASILTMIALFSINLAHHGPAEHRPPDRADRADAARAARPLDAGPEGAGGGRRGTGRSPAPDPLPRQRLRPRHARHRRQPAHGASPGRADRRRPSWSGMALSNALVALAGALFAQTAGFADISIGTGTIVVGLAAVIVGETILPSRHIGLVVLACLLGSILYRLAVALALNSDVLGLTASDLNLVTAVLVGLALILPSARNPLKALLTRRAAP